MWGKPVIFSSWVSLYITRFPLPRAKEFDVFFAFLFLRRASSDLWLDFATEAGMAGVSVWLCVCVYCLWREPRLRTYKRVLLQVSCRPAVYKLWTDWTSEWTGLVGWHCKSLFTVELRGNPAAFSLVTRSLSKLLSTIMPCTHWLRQLIYVF